MGFVQIIEYKTSHADEIQKLADQWASATEGRRTATRSTGGEDQDRPGIWVQIVEFPSSDAAARNSELPETAQLAAQIAELCDGPPVFRNIDLTQTVDL